ncbi:hypothetical protein I6F11_11435 [Ensifer sp. NBAIM29]|nr:hypothetical protein [Ensifer sp. NBAIM29]
MEFDLRRRELTRAGGLRDRKYRIRIGSGWQEWLRHAAADQAALGCSAIAAAVITGIGVVRTDAQRVAEGVELRGDRHFAEGESANGGLQDEQAGCDKRQSPTFASSQHNRCPFPKPPKTR